MESPIPLFEIAWDEQDLSNAVESITRGSYWANGPFIDQFECLLSEFFSVDHAIVVNSGTTALTAALRALGIGHGDEVIVPSFTFIATANAVRLVGAKPVFADIEPETYGLDPESVRECLSEHTAGIVPVHLYGTPCRIDELVEIAKESDVAIIEDAAEAFGAKHKSALVGTFGDSGVFSFCQNKILPTGEGGAIVTDDEKIATKLRHYRSHGRASGEYFDRSDSGEYVALGTNIRMPDLTAAIGCAQFAKLDQLIEGRRSAAAKLNEAIGTIDGIRPPRTHPDGTHVYQLYTIELEHNVDRNHVIDTLEAHGISSKIYWDTPVHRTTYYRETYNDTVDLTVTENVADRVLTLPMYPALSPKDIDRIIDALTAALSQHD